MATFNTINQRVAVLYDSGLLPYPDITNNIVINNRIDRAFLCNLFNYWEVGILEIWEKSYLGNIYYNLVQILNEIGSTNQEDFNKATFPLFNIYLNDEVNERDFNTPNMDAFSNKVTFRIDCFNKINHESSNALFDADVVLDNLLKLFITKINANKTINSLTEGEFYITSRRERSGFGNDIFIPKKLIINFTVNYSQSMLDPLIPAYA